MKSRTTLFGLVLSLAPLATPACTPEAGLYGARADAGGDGAASPIPDGAAAPGSDGAATGPGDAASPAAANTLACRLLQSGPFTAVTSIPVYTYSNLGPPISHGTATYRVTLPGASKAGHISFMVPATGEYVLFTSRSLPITVFSWAGTVVLPSDISGSVPECANVKTRESFFLETDTKAHVIKLGGDSEAAVDVVLTKASP